MSPSTMARRTVAGRCSERIASAMRGPDARDAAQQVEEIALVEVGEAVQGERVLAHDQLGLQRDELGRLSREAGRRGRRVHAQAHARRPRSRARRGPPTSAGRAGSRSSGLPCRARRADRPRMAERDGERIGRVLGGRRHPRAAGSPDHAPDLLLGRRPEPQTARLTWRGGVLGARRCPPRRRPRARRRAPARPRGSRAGRARRRATRPRPSRARAAPAPRRSPPWMRWQALGGVGTRARGDVAVGERADALALDPDHAEPRAGEAGIDAEHDHGVIVRGRADGERRALPLVPSKTDARAASARRGVRRTPPQVLPRRDHCRRRADPRARRRRPVPDRRRRRPVARGLRRDRPNFRPTRWIARRILPTGEYRTGQAEGMRAEQLIRRADGRPSVLVATEECPTGENEDEPGGESFGYTTLIGRTPACAGSASTSTSSGRASARCASTGTARRRRAS